jgi:hypothetical protein
MEVPDLSCVILLYKTQDSIEKFKKYNVKNYDYPDALEQNVSKY